VALPELIAMFSELQISSNTQPDDQPQTHLQQEFQQASLQILESWLVQYPTAAHAAQQNSDMPAIRLLPLMRPVEQLIKSWGVEAIAPVGSEHPYDPHLHQLMEGTAEVGDRVKIRYAGYRQGEKLLHRAKVSPVTGSPAIGSPATGSPVKAPTANLWQILGQAISPPDLQRTRVTLQADMPKQFHPLDQPASLAGNHALSSERYFGSRGWGFGQVREFQSSNPVQL
jgi:hypothetical protein